MMPVPMQIDRCNCHLRIPQDLQVNNIGRRDTFVKNSHDKTRNYISFQRRVEKLVDDVE